MSQRDSELWERARSARDKLVDKFLDHPDVRLIDIGMPLEEGDKEEEVALRIHVKERWFASAPSKRIAFPSEIGGFRVFIIRGDYELE